MRVNIILMIKDLTKLTDIYIRKYKGYYNGHRKNWKYK